MNQFNELSYTKFKENERLAARNDWQRFVTNDARLADSLETIARRAGLEAVYIYDTDPDRENTETVCIACTPAKLDELIAEARASTRRIACWGSMGQAPTARGAFLRHFAEWLTARWYAHRENALRPLINAIRGGAALDLDSPRTLTFWMEYLSEYSERAQAWGKFERVAMAA